MLGAGQEGTLIKARPPTRRPAKRLSYQVNWAKQALAQKELLVKPLPRENGLVAIDPYGQEAKLSLRKYHVDVYIEDGIARTTIDQTFFNHNPWNTEGTFYFPLPQDASVSRLAMYVFGQLNEGGMVTRQRGQEIYNDILYQRRDPALLEMMEGNMFKMRIFPLEGRQEKRIFLSYTQSLDELYGQTKYMFPMEHTSDVAGELSIHVRIKDGAKQFDPRSSTHDLKSTIDGNDVVLEFDAKKVKPDQDFLLSLLPNEDKPADKAKLPKPEVRVATCEKNGRHYFSAKLTPELKGLNQPAARQWIVLNDVSASRSQIDIEAQRYVLERLVAEADDDDSVFLIDVNTIARNVSDKPVNVRSADIRPIVNHRPERVIGATDLSAGFKAAAEVVQKFGFKNPHVLYLGDGVATDGEKSISELTRAIPSICKFIGVGVGKKVDSLFLQEAANLTGGTFATINPNEDIDWRVFDLLASMNTARMTNIKVELLDKNDRLLDATVYANSSVLAAGETLTVMAMSDSALPAAVRFEGRVGTKLVTKTARISDAKTDADYLPRLWAKRHIDELLKSDMSDEDVVISLSKEFYIVTPYTSLIVLEDDEMYREYDVERGRTDHWASYDAPKKIDVIKEPLPRNNQWWGQFEGEDSQVKVTDKPKTVQQIIDNIQIRMHAPFYVWNNQDPYNAPRTSRKGLYKLCDLPADGDSERAKLLTLYLLLAGGDRDTAMNLGRVANGDSRSEAVDERITLHFDGGLAIKREVALNRFTFRTGDLINVQEIRDSERRLGAANIFATGGQAPRIVLTPADDQIAVMHGSWIGLGGRSSMPKRTYNYDPGVTPRALEATNFLPPKISRSVNQAINKRWSRLERDTRKYNSRNWGGYNHWGWEGAEGDSIDAERWPDLLGSQASEIMEGFEVEDFEPMEPPQLIPSFFRPRLQQSRELSFNGISDGLSETLFGTTPNFGPRIGNQRDIYRPFGNSIDNDGDGVIDGYFYEDVDRFFLLPPIQYEMPRSYVEESRRSITDQPGLTAILAADNLAKQLKEFDKLAVEQPDGLTKPQLALQRAMQVAIKNIQRTSARLENSAAFWGNQGWSYRPLAPTVHAPTIQMAPRRVWSKDLTRYARGLDSTTDDMIAEVESQYGVKPAAGKIDAVAARLIKQARENFQTVEIRFADDGTKYKVGSNGQLAFSTTSDMLLTERYVCDGKQIVQVYDELGLASRRPATRSRLDSLQQLAPHMISDVDSLIQFYDVRLVETDDDSTTVKVTLPDVAKPEQSEEATSEDSDEQQNAKQKQAAHMVVRFDNRGRVLSRQLMVDDQEFSATQFSYTDDQVTVNWKVRVESKSESDPANKFETGEESYFCKRLDTDASPFAVKLDRTVVIDMPLMKPDFYQQKIAKLIEGAEQKDTKELDLNKLDRKATLELIRLYQHLTLSKLQELSRNPYNGFPDLQTTMLRFKQLKQHADQQFFIGELAIFGGIDQVRFNQLFNKGDLERLESTALYQFFHLRRYAATKPKDAQRIADGLVEHISAYDEAFRSQTPAAFQTFRERFDESPLTLGLATQMYGRGSSFRIDELVKLNEDPRWEGVALLTAASMRDDDSDKKIADAFWKWQEKLAKDDQHPVFMVSILDRIRNVDRERLLKYLGSRLDEIAKTNSLSQLIEFTEQVGSMGEQKLSERGYDLIRKRLRIDDADAPLLHRFVFAQALWTSGNLEAHEAALEQYELILAQLKSKQIDPSPSFIAAMARLCVAAGQSDRAVELEEEALRLGQPYLPSAINLQAFRQRYNWLWNQYSSALTDIAETDPEREQKIDKLLKRAAVTWHRWNDVDRDNVSLPTRMANLLQKAGRDQEAWEYVSTVLDKRPRDAATYGTLGNWYQQQGDFKAASRWYEQAPQWDTANPQWIMTYARSLKKLGKDKEARTQYQKVIDGTWAPGLQQYVQQATQELNSL